MASERNPDEFVVRDVSMVHMEMMDDKTCWMGIYHADGQIDHFTISSNHNLKTLWSVNIGNLDPTKIE